MEHIKFQKIKKPDIIIYGGAFDPPHRGHLQAIHYVSLKFINAKIIIIPANIPAASGKTFKTPLASFEHRFNMCNLVFNKNNLNISNEVIVSKIEQNMPTPNFTIYTIYKLKQEYGDKKFGLLIGADQFRVFPRWHEPKQILSLCDLIVVKRKENVVTNEVKQSRYEQNLFEEQIKWLASTLNLSIDFDIKNEFAYIKIFNNCIYFMNVNICDAKSSVIQNLLREQKPIPQEWLTAEVVNYIKEHNLYHS